jgi:DNA helicase-2/ATP-dependent DNA helicase PcrA
MIPLTDEQQIAVDYPDTLALTSCPGSGKTRTIIVKLHKCIEEIRGTPRKIACITFTNSGVDEIETRLRQFTTHVDMQLCEVSTIHSFCLNNILRPFSHLVPHLNGEWSIVTRDDEWFTVLVADLKTKYRLTDGQVDQFDGLQPTFPKGDPSPNDLPAEPVAEFFKSIDDAHKVTFGGIVYFSAKLVEDHKFIRSALAARFAWYIVDEFQDTTLAQVEILLRVFEETRSKLFLVGDPNQSILSVAGAKPELMEAFAKRIKAKTDCKLTKNFRCSKLIVQKAELLCASALPMQAVGESRDFHAAPMYKHCKSAVDGIVEYFIPALDEFGIAHGNAAILAPWWRHLGPIGRELRERQIGVIGPGSRPYKKTAEFARLSESLAAFLGCEDAETAAGVQKSLFVTLSNITETPRWILYKYHGQRIVFRIINLARRVFEAREGAVDWLTETAAGCEDILINEELLTESHRGLFVASVNAMIADMVRHNVDVGNLPALDLGMVASPKNSISLLSMHNSKGREFEAVAVVHVHDDTVPHFGDKNNPAKIDESKRLLYVAVTRAKKLLMLLTDKSHYKNVPSRFLRDDYLKMC